MATTPSKPGIPESFNVLVKEMRALGLNVELRQNAMRAGGSVSVSKRPEPRARTPLPGRALQRLINENTTRGARQQ